MKDKRIIGRKDKVDFPNWRIADVPVKIDTGAYTSSVHCESAELSEDGLWLTAVIEIDDQRHEIRTQNFETKWIRSSMGRSEKRYVVDAVIRIFEHDYKMKVSLSQRDSMKTPVLLGRRLLNGLFVVDPSKKNLSFKNKSKKQ